MKSNNFLRALHFERLARTKAIAATAATAASKKDPAFSCAVCYTDGSKSGLVIPACCSHKICLLCYSNMLIRSKTASRCPECRAQYLQTEDIIEDSFDEDYLDMPPLIPINYNTGRENFTDLYNGLDLEQRISVLYLQLTREFVIQNAAAAETD